MKLRLSAAAALVVSLVSTGAALANSHPQRTSLSLYEHTTTPSVLGRQGCAAGRRGESGVVVLDFGKPAYSRRYGYGTIDFSDRYVSNHQITMGMLGWARGYVRCLPPHSALRVMLARGTSNYHASVPSALAAGNRWAGAVIALQRKLHRHRLGAHVQSTAADDAEPAWDPGFHQTRRFIHGFRSWAHGRTLYDYGSLDGGVGAIWSARQMMYVTGGAGRTAVLPEIYYPAQAREWAEFAYLAHRWFHRRVHFAGVMTQGSATCGCGYLPNAAHRALVRELGRMDTGRTRVPHVGTTIVTGN